MSRSSNLGWDDKGRKKGVRVQSCHNIKLTGGVGLNLVSSESALGIDGINRAHLPDSQIATCSLDTLQQRGVCSSPSTML